MRTGKFQRVLTFVCALLMAQGAWAQDAAVVGHVKIGDLYYNLDVQNHTAQVTYDPTDSGEKYKGLTAVSIPASVSYEEQEFSVSSIGHSAFTYCYAMTGLTIGSGVKDADCTLYVPAESADLYKAANIWKGFNVVAMKAEPSLALKQLMSGGECTVYTFNYPSVSASGEPTVLSSALFAWTPSEREETDSIESLHIYSHATITADYERPSTNEGFSKEQALLLLFPNREYGNVLADEYTIDGRRLSVKPTQKGVYINKGMKVVVR